MNARTLLTDGTIFNSSQKTGLKYVLDYDPDRMLAPSKTNVTQPVMENSKKKGIEGTVGIGSWATSANFKDIKVTNKDTGKVVYSSKDAKDTSAFSVATQRGEWEAAKGVFTQKSMATPAFMALDNESEIEGMQNYTLELQAQKTGGAEGFLISFGVKGENFYWWNMGGWGNTQSCVEKGSLGGRSIIGDSKPMNLLNGKWYKIKIVNVTEETQNVKISLKNAPALSQNARVTVISGGADDENSFRVPKQVAPASETFSGVSSDFTYPAKPCSLTILEIDAKQATVPPWIQPNLAIKYQK